MNTRLAGGVMLALSTATGIAGGFAGSIANSTAGINEQGGWAVGCFRGGLSDCRAARNHDAFVEQWSDRGIQIAIGSGLLFIIGASLIAASMGQKHPMPKSEEDSVSDLTPEEKEKLHRIEREASLRGGRLT